MSDIFGYDKKQIPNNLIEVINKIDKCDVNKDYKNTKNKVYISAHTGEGIDNLIKLINKRISINHNKKIYY